MNTEVTWRIVPLVSHLHAAEAIVRGRPMADQRLAEALAAPAAMLQTEIRAANLPSERFWRTLIPQAASTSVRRQLVETCVVKTAGRSPRLASIVTTVSAAVAAVETAGQTALPNLVEELDLRERPLREQWEARGPGLLNQIGLMTEPELVPEACLVLPVYPATGGGGEAHLVANSVRIEAVLANPVAELPEIVRLAWLIAQLETNLPAYSDAIHASRLPHIAQYAMLPAALAAAEYVELLRASPETMQLAVRAWGLAVPSDVDAAALIGDWWQTYQATRPPWRVALAALDQLFG
jgi:hypothetical protein